MEVEQQLRPAPEQQSHPAYEQCDNCGAPLDAAQRYCVECGAHRRHVRDPAARYLSTATARARKPTGTRRASKRSPGLGTALILAVIPLAVGLGVIVGRSSNNGDDKLIAALKSQQPQVITTSGGSTAASTGSSTSVASLKSTYPLSSGYTVEISTVSTSGQASSKVSQAEQTAKSKGAKDVGLIVQSDFKLTPAPPSGTYVIYSGAYKSSGPAQQALTKLKKSFPGAKVLRVQPITANPAPSTKVLAHSAYGVAHQVVGFKPSASQLAADGQIVKHIQQTVGKSYVNSQRGLPDQISVP